MSRRARRKKKEGGSARWMRVAGVLLVLGIVGMGGAYLWLRTWLHSEDFRVMLSEQAGKALGAEAKFGAFKWDGTQMRTESFDAGGVMLVESLAARGLEIDIGLGRVREGVVELREGRIAKLDVRLDLDAAKQPKPEREPVVDAAPKERAWYEGFVPDEIELTGLDVGNSAVSLEMKSGPATFSGTQWEIRPGDAKKSYLAVARGGTIRFPWDFVPVMELSEAKLRYHDRTVFLTRSDFRLFRRGVLDLAGEASLAGDGFAFDGRLRDVRAEELVPEDWKQRISGDIEGDFTVLDADPGVRVSGTVTLKNGVLTGLPVLDSLGAYGGSPRFRRLALSEAHADFVWDREGLLVTDLVLASEGLIRVVGMMRVDRDDNLDGRFRVGLTPGTLALIPGAETKVFLPGENGLLWTTLRISGTLDNPKEDLSERLILAAGLRMFEVLPETGEQVLKYSTRVVGEDLTKNLELGKSVIEGGERMVLGGKGLFDGEGDVIEEAADVARQAEDVARGLGGIFDTIRGKEERPARGPIPIFPGDERETVKPEPEEEPEVEPSAVEPE